MFTSWMCLFQSSASTSWMCSHHESTMCVIAYVFSAKFRVTTEALNKPTYFNDKCEFTKKLKMKTIQQQYSHINVCMYIAMYKIALQSALHFYTMHFENVTFKNCYFQWDQDLSMHLEFHHCHFIITVLYTPHFQHCSFLHCHFDGGHKMKDMDYTHTIYLSTPHPQYHVLPC